MKKIMFNDKYGLTEAVLSGRKTMTRRAVRLPAGVTLDEWVTADIGLDDKNNVMATFMPCVMEEYTPICDVRPQYQYGEEVAVAQRYCDMPCSHFSNLSKQGINLNEQKDGTLKGLFDLKGWTNKMYVRADAMPHRVRITDIKIEQLQYISDEDCLREGIQKRQAEGCWQTTYYVSGMYQKGLERERILDTSLSPRETFAELIDRISGRGIWEKNPWVWAYTFELVK